jgi:hypothetical protein
MLETLLKYCHVYEWHNQRGLLLDIGFSDSLDTRLGTTSNYSSVDNLQNSQITAAPAKFFPACCILTSRFMATTSNNEDSSAARVQVLSERRLPSDSFLQTLIQN